MNELDRLTDEQMMLIEATDEALVLFLRWELESAYILIKTHYRDDHGWCSHQGATRVKYRWPCRLYVCAHQAIVESGVQRRPPPAPKPPRVIPVKKGQPLPERDSKGRFKSWHYLKKSA